MIEIHRKFSKTNNHKISGSNFGKIKRSNSAGGDGEGGNEGRGMRSEKNLFYSIIKYFIVLQSIKVFTK
jgi:hypothetical protein